MLHVPKSSRQKSRCRTATGEMFFVPFEARRPWPLHFQLQDRLGRCMRLNCHAPLSGIRLVILDTTCPCLSQALGVPTSLCQGNSLALTLEASVLPPCNLLMARKTELVQYTVDPLWSPWSV